MSSLPQIPRRGNLFPQTITSKRTQKTPNMLHIQFQLPRKLASVLGSNFFPSAPLMPPPKNTQNYKYFLSSKKINKNKEREETIRTVQISLAMTFINPPRSSKPFN